MFKEISTYIGSNEFKRTSPFLKNKTAILTVDMQKEYCIPGRDPSHPELDSKSFFHSELRNLVIPNQVKIISLARKLNIEVIPVSYNNDTSWTCTFDINIHDNHTPKWSELKYDHRPPMIQKCLYDFNNIN